LLEKPDDAGVDYVSVVLNMKTAKVLGLEVPPGLSARADQVIE